MRAQPNAVGRPDVSERPDINTRADIVTLVTEFYRRAFADPQLGPIFVDVAQLDLPAHLPVICDFWQAVIFRAGTYRRNAFGVHAELHARVRLTPELFTRWLELWMATVDNLHSGPHTDRAKLQAHRIAESMSRRLADAPPAPAEAETTPASYASSGAVTASGRRRRPSEPD
ncbi:group III truncated hemoglobin [Frankia tisae]|uniref:group III truncated hemoglobin n=1 Tax=Frankia tisae TaxID=2950104 RepID=UPI0021BE6122|nr:group III truncated hemoglobin [Frankia tisae]